MNVLAIIRKELYSYFFSPILWVVFAVFLFIMGFMFVSHTTLFANQYARYAANRSAMQSGQVFNLTAMVVGPMLGNMSFVLLLLVPTLTMRLLAEEHNQGTMELLLTRPITVTQLILSKYLAAVAVLLLLLICTTLYPLLLSIYGTLDLGPIYVGYLGTFLMGCCFLALGLFASALTTSQLVAAIVALGGNLLFWIIAWMSQSLAETWKTGAAVLVHLSLPGHIQNGVRGVFDSVDMIYFLSFIAFFLFLTHRIVDSMRWR